MVKNKVLYRVICFLTSILIISSHTVYAQSKVSVSVPIQCISKDENETLTYHIKAEAQNDGQIIQNETLNLKNDEKDFFNIEYLCPGTYKYEINQLPGINDDIVYDVRTYTASVYVSENHEGIMNADIITYVTGSNEKSDGAIFVNKIKCEDTDENCSWNSSGGNYGNDNGNSSKNNVYTNIAKNDVARNHTFRLNNVETGDNSNLFSIGMTLLSSICIATIALKSKRRGKK